ncbi:MAG: hypothetical protein H0U66_12590 [Gemmatimonadaceae bacterium]|nr:hypothetical protein [Gemmatimonadaceae bacterium]
MNKTKLMFAGVAACLVLAGCAKNDANSLTGNHESTSVSLSSDSTAYHISAGLDNAVAFSPVATLEPEGVAIANGTQNMVYTFGNEDIAHLNDDGNLQGYSAGSTTVTITYTDVDHAFATTTLTIPITVSAAPPPPPSFVPPAPKKGRSH